MRVLWLPCLAIALAASSVFAADEDPLIRLAQDWRRAEATEIRDCRPDYSAEAIARKAAMLKKFRAALAGLGKNPASLDQSVDRQLLEAEMNGLDFNLRVLRPWARDPSFYATIFGEESDVPAHEGQSAAPVIDLFRYRYPLSAPDQRSLTCLLGAVPELLAQAKLSLKDSEARDLWLYGARAFREQSAVLAALEAGTLSMRTLSGANHASLTGADPALLAAVKAARLASDEFADWVLSQAPDKHGPSGVGKENYSWYQKKVQLVPYDWEQQVTLLQRELDRAQAGLRIEEFHNRKLPPLQPIDDPAAFPAFGAAKMAKLTEFLIVSGIVPDQPNFRDAMNQQIGAFVPPAQRNFFTHAIAHDPLGLYTHDYHWIELARLHDEPNADPIRRAPPIFNMFAARSEGLATALEETLMQAGLYDDVPRGREIVWAMLANRAARGLASLYVQANQMSLQEAGHFHAEWTPKGWSDPNSDLVAFEQLLYLRQPGYGTSYVTGKALFERLIDEDAHEAEARGGAFSLPDFFTRFNRTGILPWPLTEQAMGLKPVSLSR